MSDCTITTNPDVSGIGIRANLYATVLLMALIPDLPGRTSPLVEVLAENAGISGLALLITAINETRRGNLSLYHAIYIIHMLYFTGIMVAPAGHYKRNTEKRRAILSGLITYGCYLLFTMYGLYVWGKGTKFWDVGSFTCPNPNNEEINSKIEYIVFFRPVPVSAIWLRVVWMAGLGVSLALLVFVPVFGCISVFGQGVIPPQGQPPHPKNPLFLWVLWVGKILTAVYGVATLEIYEKTNLHSGVLAGPEDEWTFGQVFAMVQLVTTLNEAIHCFMSINWDDSDDEDRGSVTSTHGRNSTASSRIIRLVGLRTGSGQASAEGEAINLDTIRRPTSTVQPLLRRQTHAAMTIV
ncbi:hypothetical protein JOM56_014619 [Amanita muscaria]